MLCPDCECAAPGGSPCPECGEQVPERECFAGQGGRYLVVLVAISLVLFVAVALFGAFLGLTRHLTGPGWIWLSAAVSVGPLGVGLHYWFMLREEELVVTEEYIERRSRWGDQCLAWSDVQQFRRRPTLFGQVRLVLIAGLSRRFGEWGWPPTSYDLIGPPDAGGTPTCMRLEPGTIDDLSWLLSLVEERVGPPVQD